MNYKMRALPLSAFLMCVGIAGEGIAAGPANRIKAGMIGLDTSHVVAFTQLLSDPNARGELAEMSIVAAYPGGSPDLPASWNCVKEYTNTLRGMGVEIVDSIDALLRRVDAVLLMSVDGRPHWSQAQPAILAGKPLFIDKPMAASLADAMRIFRLARQKEVPCFSASSLRFSPGFQATRDGKSFGEVRKCTAWSPMHLEPHHPDLFWYGIHGVETLFTILGPGCESVTRLGPEKVLGVWKDGRQGTFVAKEEYGAAVEGAKGSGSAGKYEGYAPLVIEIVRFFKTGKPPVSPEETLELLAFMEAADESKRHGGTPVTIESVLKKAEKELAEAATGAHAEGPVPPSVPVPLSTAAPAPVAVVEVEEDVYRYEPANNGAGPFWCHGSTCLVRIGENVLASGLETLKEFKPLNNCRWVLFKRTAAGWERQQADQTGRTREPCPLAGFPDGRLFLSVNPAMARDPEERQCLARPEILQFSAADPQAPFQTILPVWEGNPPFIDHSYRSFAADGPSGELILFQNIEWNHAEWSFRDKDGKWASGKLVWPWGAEYPVPQPIRVCYPNVALRNRAVHFCGISDIDEPYPEWKAFKQQMPDKGGDFNGVLARNWGCDFRRLWYAWSADITSGKFRPWLELANRDTTCGFIRPGDLWVAADGAAHVVWTEQAIETRLRERFFPGTKQVYQLNYAVVCDGKVRSRRTLVETGEGISGELLNCPRFQVTPDGRLFVCYYVGGTDAAGKPVSENRLIQLFGDTASPPVKIPLVHPISGSLPMMYFTASVRAGSPPSIYLDLLGQRADASQTISYARIRL